MSKIDLASPDHFINRELSLLQFHKRVLAQALDSTIPLLERLRFLCISSSALDEFFEIRVAGLKHQAELGIGKRGPDNQTPAEVLRQIRESASALIEEQYRVLNQVLLPELNREGVRFLARNEWTAEQAEWIKEFFKRELAPIMSPLGLDPAHPFPRPLNKSLAFIVNLKGKDAFGRNSGKAIVQAPRALPRVVRLPAECAEGANDFVLLSAIIDAHMDELFSGMQATGVYQFRVTRNSDLFVDEEEVDDLLRALEGELPSRRYGDAARLEVAQDCPPELENYLMAQFALSAEDVYRCHGPVNLMRLAAVPGLVDRPDLKYPGFRPGVPRRMRSGEDIFAAIAAGDILLHQPFQSFTPFIEFLRQAARDPQVLAIRQTLYRTGAQSLVVDALREAAANGKEVLVVIELRARFDEEANIELANHLQSVGAQVVYGVVGHKTHAKMCLVIRREGRALKRYAHLSTGNYHAATARLYTDYGFFTCDSEIVSDVQKVFQQLTALGKAGRMKKLLQSPFTLHKGILAQVRRETANAKAGKPARIMAKMNSLVDRSVIQALYRASQAGVQVDLIVRSICVLRPGIPGVSENIRVRSVVGRFLEHTRVFYFENDGDARVFLSSADWMGRNFFNRVEVCFPIEDERLRARVVEESFTGYLADNCQAWELKSDGGYEQAVPDGARRSAQESLCQTLAAEN